MSSIHEPEYQRIIEILIAMREAAGLSQKDIAQCLNLSQPDVSKIERRERRIDILEALRWVRSTGNTPAQFVTKIEDLQ